MFNWNRSGGALDALWQSPQQRLYFWVRMGSNKVVSVVSALEAGAARSDKVIFNSDMLNGATPTQL